MTADDRYVTTGRVSARARRALDDLHTADPNFDIDGLPTSESEGWKVDDWVQQLPSEVPGDPVQDGSFEVCRRLLHDYAFADPGIVRAVYLRDQPLAQRDMVIEARFYGLKFLLGLRVAEVRDERTEREGRPVQLWGWSYRTLDGHLEMGQMDFEVRKWRDTGAVEFRIHSVSKPARIDNPIVRLGFALFGRWMQERFARNALTRMGALVERDLAARQVFGLR